MTKQKIGARKKLCVSLLSGLDFKLVVHQGAHRGIAISGEAENMKPRRARVSLDDLEAA